LLYGSDCNDWVGEGEKCSGAQQIAMMKKLAPDPKIQRKIFWENSAKLFRIKA
jgi:predicted TIM-barrel fold metal-dependent hydrolase